MVIVGIKINDIGKISYFDSNGFRLKQNLTVIVDTDRGLQFGKVVELNVPKDEDTIYKKVVRVATKKDYLQYLKNNSDAEKAIIKCKELISKNNLNMAIIDANYNFERSQLLFRFVSDERVDFRNLAKELGSKLKTRIELRQIGIRDKAKEIGGIGPCGRFLCCNTFLTNFNTVSINMAKNQGLALNPSKINGVCGRLLCCLNYENEQYSAIREELPKLGEKITVNKIEGKVISIEPLRSKYKIITGNNEIIDVEKNDS